MTPLNKTVITSYLDALATKAFPIIECFDELASTNDYLLECSPMPGTVCIAQSQSSGKGRLGRTWFSPSGNIYLSFYWRFSCSLAALSGLTLIIALTVCEALESIQAFPGEGLKVKWPNDIEYEGAKLGGVLAETHRHGGIVIGVGINLEMPESLTDDDRKITDLKRLWGVLPSRAPLIGACLTKWAQAMPLLSDVGFKAFMSRWTQYDALKGKSLSLVSSKELLQGKAMGVNERGELLLAVPGTSVLRTIASVEGVIAQ